MVGAKRPAEHRLVAWNRHRQALARDDEGLVVDPAGRREASAARGVPHHELAGAEHDRLALEVQADRALAHVQQAEEVRLAGGDLGRAPAAVAAIVHGMDERQAAELPPRRAGGERLAGRRDRPDGEPEGVRPRQYLKPALCQVRSLDVAQLAGHVAQSRLNGHPFLLGAGHLRIDPDGRQDAACAAEPRISVDAQRALGSELGARSWAVFAGGSTRRVLSEVHPSARGRWHAGRRTLFAARRPVFYPCQTPRELLSAALGAARIEHPLTVPSGAVARRDTRCLDHVEDWLGWLLWLARSHACRRPLRPRRRRRAFRAEGRRLMLANKGFTSEDADQRGRRRGLRRRHCQPHGRSAVVALLALCVWGRSRAPPSARDPRS